MEPPNLDKYMNSNRGNQEKSNFIFIYCCIVIMFAKWGEEQQFSREHLVHISIVMVQSLFMIFFFSKKWVG